MKRRVMAIVALVALGVCTWQVYRIRARLSAGDADPRILADMKERLAGLPRVLGDGEFVGEPLPLTEEMSRMGGADAFAYMRYRDRTGHVFDIYLGGAVRNDENFHSPSYCMPAGGWEVQQDRLVPFTVHPVESGHPAMRRMVLQHASNRMLVYYWFQAGPRIAHHSWLIRWYRFLDLLASKPFRPTLIISVYAHVQDDVEETEEALGRFLEAVAPYLRDIT